MLALVSCIEGWRYWDGELLRLLSEAPEELFLEEEDDGESKKTPQ